MTKKRGDMDWLGMELAIRNTLHKVFHHDCDAIAAIAEIDDIIARFTKRGAESNAPTMCARTGAI
jgi:hypothetical protein